MIEETIVSIDAAAPTDAPIPGALARQIVADLKNAVPRVVRSYPNPFPHCAQLPEVHVVRRSIEGDGYDLDGRYDPASDVIEIELASALAPQARAYMLEHEMIHRCFTPPGNQVVEPWAYVGPLLAGARSLRERLAERTSLGNNRFVRAFLEHAAILGDKPTPLPRPDSQGHLLVLEKDMSHLLQEIADSDLNRAAELWRTAYQKYMENTVFWDVLASNWVEPTIIQHLLIAKQRAAWRTNPNPTSAANVKNFMDTRFDAARQRGDKYDELNKPEAGLSPLFSNLLDSLRSDAGEAWPNAVSLTYWSAAREFLNSDGGVKSQVPLDILATETQASVKLVEKTRQAVRDRIAKTCSAPRDDASRNRCGRWRMLEQFYEERTQLLGKQLAQFTNTTAKSSRKVEK